MPGSQVSEEVEEGKGKAGGNKKDIPQRVQVSLSLCIDVPLRDIVKVVEVGCWFEVAHGCGGDERERRT
jgi:hypothetical protein